MRTSLIRPDMNKEDIPQDLKEEWNKILKKTIFLLKVWGGFETGKDHVKRKT